MTDALLVIIAANVSYQTGLIILRQVKGSRRSMTARQDLSKVMGSSPLAQGRNGMP